MLVTLNTIFSVVGLIDTKIYKTSSMISKNLLLGIDCKTSQILIFGENVKVRENLYAQVII